MAGPPKSLAEYTRECAWLTDDMLADPRVRALVRYLRDEMVTLATADTNPDYGLIRVDKARPVFDSLLEHGAAAVVAQAKGGEHGTATDVSGHQPADQPSVGAPVPRHAGPRQEAAVGPEAVGAEVEHDPAGGESGGGDQLARALDALRARRK